MKYYTKTINTKEASRVISSHLIQNRVPFVWETFVDRYEVTVAIEDKSRLNVVMANVTRQPPKSKTG